MLKILGLTHFCHKMSTRYVPRIPNLKQQGDGSFQWMGTRRIEITSLFYRLIYFDVICLDSVDVGNVVVVVAESYQVWSLSHLFAFLSNNKHEKNQQIILSLLIRSSQ